MAEVFEFVDQECLLEIEEAGAEQEEEAFGPQEKAAAAPDAAHPETNTNGPAAPSTAKGTTFIRVDLSRVDRLVNMVGELVITQAMLAQQLSESGGGQRQPGPRAAKNWQPRPGSCRNA